ncbi:hypothetical protein BM1_03165 [Bipolaris maydis]|nr:hypothetical protein BM1_03165 [Bipolaris maydis]
MVEGWGAVAVAAAAAAAAAATAAATPHQQGQQPQPTSKANKPTIARLQWIGAELWTASMLARHPDRD